MKTPGLSQRIATSALAIYLLSTVQSSADEAKPKISVVTAAGNLAFSCGSEVYRIGMSAEDFVKRFGPPEGKYVDELCYYSKGVEVAVDPVTKTIRQMTFFYVAVDNSDAGGGKYRPGDIATDMGIAAGATRGQIVKAHGKPESEEPEVAGTSTFEYPWGRFYFARGILQMVEIQNPSK